MMIETIIVNIWNRNMKSHLRIFNYSINFQHQSRNQMRDF